MRGEFIHYHDLDGIRRHLCVHGQCTSQDLGRLHRIPVTVVNTVVKEMCAAGMLSRNYLGGVAYISLPPGTAVFSDKFKPLGISVNCHK